MLRRSAPRSVPRWRPALAAALAVLALGGGASSQEVFTFHHENVMGTSLELTVRAPSRESAAAVEARVLAEIDRLTAILSNHDPESDLRRWQEMPAGRPVVLPPEMLDVLAQAERWRVASRGAFDPRAAAFSRIWADAARRGARPGPAGLRAVADRLASAPWTLDPAAGTATRRDDLPVTLDGIAKGYIVERAAAAGLEAAPGVSGLLLNVGGDLRAVGSTAAAVGVAPGRDDQDDRPPDATVNLCAASLATSGGAYRGVTIDGRWYSHVIDPRTGEPAGAVVAASVVATDGADADALATIANVLPPEEAIRLVESVPGASCRIATRDGRIRTSRGWSGRENRPAVALATSAQDGAAKGAGAWGDRFELAVEFEINRPTAEPGRYRRPYVVVWIEDEAGKTLRTLSLWVSLGGAGPDQWLPDLRRWYRGEDQKALSAKKNLIYTIARPTRPPGRYTVVWDGKDDKGRPVPAGRYNVFVEAAREHGTNGLIRTAVPLGEAPFQATLPGNVEIKSATVTLRQKAPTASLAP
jgi:thiamine biosynthesis lipoprotein ApbE